MMISLCRERSGKGYENWPAEYFTITEIDVFSREQIPKQEIRISVFPIFPWVEKANRARF